MIYHWIVVILVIYDANNRIPLNAIWNWITVQLDKWVVIVLEYRFIGIITTKQDSFLIIAIRVRDICLYESSHFIVYTHLLRSSSQLLTRRVRISHP